MHNIHIIREQEGILELEEEGMMVENKKEVQKNVSIVVEDNVEANNNVEGGGEDVLKVLDEGNSREDEKGLTIID